MSACSTLTLLRGLIDMTGQEAMQKVDAALMILREHFDSVQILASWVEEEMTHRASRGCGNWYSRQGLAHEFIEMDRAQEIGRELSKQMPPPPPEDDAEQWKKE